MRETQSKKICVLYIIQKNGNSPKEKNPEKRNEEKRRDEKECYDR
jgi:hypothetical protein